ncbi:MAG: uroporphyrinogen-III C-methyltransferase [Pseudomonadota bacterium]
MTDKKDNPETGETRVSEVGDEVPASAQTEQVETVSVDADPPQLEDRQSAEPPAAVSESTSAKDALSQPSETVQEATPESTPESTPAPVRPARLLALLALLLGLAAAGGVGYLYYLLVYQDPLADVNQQQDDVAQRLTDLSGDVTAQIRDLQSRSAARMAELVDQQEQRLADTEAGVVKSLNEALLAAPPTQKQWKLAEAEYLMRIANHRVLMERDSSGALSLLQTADTIIAELDDFALHQVRAQLADEMVALRQVRRDDLQGIYLRIEAVKTGLENLAIEVPEYLPEVTATPAEQTIWQTLADELSKFVRVRTRGSGEALQPLLAPDEERYLELNLRLALEQAQLAALKRHQAVFISSLESARRWIVDHMESDDAAQALLDEIDGLLQIELARPLPDISGSLNSLLQAHGEGS